jgi:hypothetical protein
MDTGESSQAQTHRGWGALSMGWCLAIMQKAFLWTTVCSIFRENHTPSTINTSFVNLEIECVHCNCCKKLDVRPLQLSILVQCQSNVVDSVDPTTFDWGKVWVNRVDDVWLREGVGQPVRRRLTEGMCRSIGSTTFELREGVGQPSRRRLTDTEQV